MDRQSVVPWMLQWRILGLEWFYGMVLHGFVVALFYNGFTVSVNGFVVAL